MRVRVQISEYTDRTVREDIMKRVLTASVETFRSGAPHREITSLPSTSAGNCFVGFDGGLAIRMVLRRGRLQIRANSKVACSTGLDPQILQARCPVLPVPRHIREAQPFRFLLHSL